MFEIREMKTEDATRVAELEKICFRSPWSLQSILYELNNESFHFYVLTEDGTVAAYCGIIDVVDEGHIANLATAPEYRRKGYARKLMEHVISTFQSKGIRDFTLEVRVGNANARALYESLGFKFAGIRPKYYENVEDAAIYWLRT